MSEVVAEVLVAVAIVVSVAIRRRRAVIKARRPVATVTPIYEPDYATFTLKAVKR